MARYYFVTITSLAVACLHRLASIALAPVRLVASVFDVAFPRIVAAEKLSLRLDLDADLIERPSDRHQAAAYMARRSQRSGNKRRGAPMNSGVASAGLAFAS